MCDFGNEVKGGNWVMKTKFPRAKTLCATLSAIAVMTASFGTGNKVSSVSAAELEPQSGDYHIIDETILPDPIFRAWVAENVDADADGYLTAEEVLAITNIDVQRMNIESLSGIQFFRNLRSLQCRSNDLTTLDVSKMPNLTWLDCSGNDLVALDASDCAKLSTLYCDDNELTSLDIENDVKLSTLYCSSNHLTELDVSTCTSIHTLFCNHNDLSLLVVMDMPRLTNLDCRNNPNLKWLIACGNPQLSNIDCSNCNMKELLPFGCNELQVLYCYGNDLNCIPALELDNRYLVDAVNGTRTEYSNGRVAYNATTPSHRGYILADADTPVVTDYADYALSEPLPIDHWKLNQLPVATPTPTPTPVPTATPTPTPTPKPTATPTPTPKPTATPTPTPVPSNVYTGNMAGKTYRISAANGWTVKYSGNSTYTFTHPTNGTVVFQVCNWGYPVFVLNNPGATSFLRNKGIYWGGWRQDLIQARDNSLTSVWYQMGIRIEVL